MNRSSRRLNSATIILAITAALLMSGSPSAMASSLTSRRVDGDHLVTEVQSNTPILSADDDLPAGFHRIIHSDLSLLMEPGRPQLPYRTFLVGLPAGKTIQITARSLASSRMGAYHLAPYVPQDGFGTEPPLPEAGRAFTRTELESAEDSSLAAVGGLYPGVLAVVQSIGVLRDQPVAEVLVYPVQYSPSDYELVHHARIEVRIHFVAATGDAARALASAPPAERLDPEPGKGPQHLQVFDKMMRGALINYDMIAQDRADRRRSVAKNGAGLAGTAGETTAAASQPAAIIGGPGTVKVSVSSDGMYQVTPAMLTSAGVDVSMVNPQTFHMTSGGADIPILVDGEGDGVFDPNDRVIFFGTGIKNDRYTKTNVYYLSYNGTAGPRIGSRSGTFTGGATTPASFTTTVHAEVNILYTSTIRSGVNEAWYWGVQSMGDPNVGTLNYPFTLTRIDPVVHTIGVRAHYLGLTGGNHEPRLFLNSTQVADTIFANQVLFTQTAAPAPSSTLLLNGSNTFTVTLINNGNSNDKVAADYFEVDYRRTYDVDGDQLMFDGEGVGKFHWSLSNLGSSNLVLLDVTVPATPQVITIPAGQISAGPPFTASFEDTLPSDRAYVISTRAALKNPPAVVLDVASSLRTPANGTDYIIITDRSLLSTVQPLANFRAGLGLRTMVVATDDIYDEFNFGRVDPSAIRSFLTYAYTTWSQLPAPAYVVLAGDGHIDFTNNFGSGAPEIVPPILRNIGGFEAPSDNDYVAVVGADVLPEMFVGRLPIRTAAFATTIVNNIVAYETNPPVSVLNHQSLFIADNDDPIFPAILDNLEAFMPPTMAAAKAYLPGNATTSTDPLTLATTDAIVAGYNNGSLLATYLGHGSVYQWATERIFQHNPNPAGPLRLDFNRLTSSGNQSFLVALNCINGYFVDLIPAGVDHVDYSLAEEALLRPNRGAIASWAPSAVGQLTDYDSISYELFSHVFTDKMTTIGPATAAALLDAVNIFGVSTTNISSMHLFGDPASRLALDSDNDGIVDYNQTTLGEATNLVVTRSGSDLVLTWDPSDISYPTYLVYAATNAPYPKSSFAPFAVVGNTFKTSFTHVGAATDGNQYDYLVRVVHPTLGPGPLGAYGQ